MSRSVPWQRTCSDLVNWRQIEAQNATIYILRETGPTGFLLKTEGEAKPCKAFLGDPHSCTCAQFMKDRDLCKHLCWLLLKKFRVPQTNPMTWQKGLVEREINEILRGVTEQMRKKVPTAISRWRRPLSNDSNGREMLPQREINADDVCPICQDELLEKRLPVTYCKYGCGNSIHIKCMKIWAEHQKTQGETTVKCPFCREDFGPIELLKFENRNAEGPTQGGRMDRHLGTTCRSCHIYPIEGKCYRCNHCTDFYLCQACFNTPIHTQHPFQYRHKRNQRWRPAGRAYGAVLPQAVMDDLVNRDISENDYDLLMQMESNAQAPVGSDIPEDVVYSFPLEKVRENGPLLKPGSQCRICLRGYHVGQSVRKLPVCKHKFHMMCIDNWLLHTRPTCPIDGQVVWDRVTAQMDEEEERKNRTKKKPATNENSTQPANQLNLEVPGTGITIRYQEPASQAQAPARGQQVVRGRPPLRRPQDRADREAARILGAIQGNFSVSGTSLNHDGAHDSDHSPVVPGGRLMNRAHNRQTVMDQRLAGLQGNGYHSNGYHSDSNGDLGIMSTQIEQENIDPLDEVIAVNSQRNNSPDHHHQHHHQQHQHHHQHERRNNHSSLFAQEVPNNHNATAHLLQNMERLAEYEHMPNIFTDSTTGSSPTGHQAMPLILDSARTLESHGVSDRTQAVASTSGVSIGNDSRSHRLMDIPPQERLFSNQNPHPNGHAPSTQTGSHVLFNPGLVASGARGVNSGVSGNKARVNQSTISSAPASIDGERGRHGERGRNQGARNRSNSRDRGRDQSRERAHFTGTIPREGENLLERLTLFSDLYLGNSPSSQNPVMGTITATGLPPRPQRKQYGNHAAARQRRFENDRRRTNLALEGSGIADVTLRDLLG